MCKKILRQEMNMKVKLHEKKNLVTHHAVHTLYERGMILLKLCDNASAFSLEDRRSI
jgi:hypothetical protein